MAFISSAPFGICSINGFGFAPNTLIGDRIPDSVKPTNPECFFLLSSISSGGQMDQSNPPHGHDGSLQGAVALLMMPMPGQVSCKGHDRASKSESRVLVLTEGQTTQLLFLIYHHGNSIYVRK